MIPISAGADEAVPAAPAAAAPAPDGERNRRGDPTTFWSKVKWTREGCAREFARLTKNGVGMDAARATILARQDEPEPVIDIDPRERPRRAASD